MSVADIVRQRYDIKKIDDWQSGVELERPWPTARVYFFEDTKDGHITVWWIETSLLVPEVVTQGDDTDYAGL